MNETETVFDLPVIEGFPWPLPEGVEARQKGDTFCLWAPALDRHVVTDLKERGVSIGDPQFESGVLSVMLRNLGAQR